MHALFLLFAIALVTSEPAEAKRYFEISSKYQRSCEDARDSIIERTRKACRKAGYRDYGFDLSEVCDLWDTNRCYWTSHTGYEWTFQRQTAYRKRNYRSRFGNRIVHSEMEPYSKLVPVEVKYTYHRAHRCVVAYCD